MTFLKELHWLGRQRAEENEEDFGPSFFYKAGSRQRDAKSVFFWKDVLKGTTKSPEDSDQSQGEQLPEHGAEFESRNWQHITKQISELL